MTLVSERWMRATTVRIENDWAETGTGFLVSREEKEGTGFLISRETDDYRLRHFVITAKHIVFPEDPHAPEPSEFYLHVNVKKKGKVIGEKITLPLRNDDGVATWREHPQVGVDVLAIDVTGFINGREDLEHEPKSYKDFASTKRVTKERIMPGDEVVIVGYPEGIHQGETNYPVFRQGMLATRIDEELCEELAVPGGSERVHTPRGFLVDGAIIKGSSGSPVVLKPVLWATIKETGGYLVHADPLLLGIIAETRDAPRRTPADHIESFAGLALAFDADTIRETVERFCK